MKQNLFILTSDSSPNSTQLKGEVPRLASGGSSESLWTLDDTLRTRGELAAAVSMVTSWRQVPRSALACSCAHVRATIT